MTSIDQASYIWTAAGDFGKDIYRVFLRKFTVPAQSGRVCLQISADSTYAVFVNGTRCPMAQVADYPQEPSFSEMDISGLVHPGDNVIAVEVHYKGEGFQTTYTPGMPFLRAAIFDEKQLLAVTDATWRWLAHPAFQSGLQVKIDWQLDFVFCYDASQDFDWKTANAEDSVWQSTFVYASGEGPWQRMRPRAVPQLLQLPMPDVTIAQAGYLIRHAQAGTFAEICASDFLSARPFPAIFSNPYGFSNLDNTIRTRPEMKANGQSPDRTFLKGTDNDQADGYYAVVDLMGERVGFLVLDITAPEGTVVDICHGEHLDDGRVRCSISGRNFTDRYVCKAGRNHFVNWHRRLGCRYLELHFTRCGQGEVTLHYAGMVPLELPLPELVRTEIPDIFLERLYAMSVNTLKLCMHEHYEDCPWREQGLYAYDSRNQILYGYYAWGNYAFAAASLDLLGRGYKGGRYLPMAAPGVIDITIPVFSLVWISELKEYQMYSGDGTLFATWRHVVDAMLDGAFNDPEPGFPSLFSPGNGKDIWNFCEWNGTLAKMTGHPQAPFNIYLLEACRSASLMHRWAGNEARAKELEAKADALTKAIDAYFWNEKKSCYVAIANQEDKFGKEYEHIQAIALAAHLPSDGKARRLIALFGTETLCPLDLSALRYCLVALMERGPEARTRLMEYLRVIFSPNVFSSSVTLWETRHGGDDFNYAGSLCHAWSAVMPFLFGAYILGVKPLAPGFQEFEVKPYAAHLDRASGEIPTPKGRISVSWVRKDGKLFVKVTHPAQLKPRLEQYEECPVADFTCTTV